MGKSIKNLVINLESKILSNNNIFITAHNEIDLDGVGASIGLSLICQHLNRPYYIVVDEMDVLKDNLVNKLINDKFKNFNFVNKEKCLELLSGKDLLILTDVNEKRRIVLKDDVDKFSDVMVIDHHELEPSSIDFCDTYIFSKSSSSCEIVAELLKNFHIKYNSDVATALLAGINLDTNNYTKNRNSTTLRAIASLMDKGGDDGYITSLFMGEYSETMKKYEIASRNNTEFRTFTKKTKISIEDNEDTTFDTTFSVAIALDHEIRGKISLAQAADYLLNFADVSITLANINERAISVHGRSKGQINIGGLFKKIDGGGTVYASATEFYDCDLDQAKQKIMTIFPLLSEAKRFVKFL